MRSICAATSSSLSSLCVVNVCATIIVLLLPNWLVICLPIVLANKRASVCVCVCVCARNASNNVHQLFYYCHYYWLSKCSQPIDAY